MATTQRRTIAIVVVAHSGGHAGGPTYAAAHPDTVAGTWWCILRPTRH